jgi:Flp pilus assembly CpaE family ATPase
MTLAGAETADRLLEVLTLDVVSFRATSRAMEAFSPLHLEGRVAFVVNRAARSEVTPGDVGRVFGEPALAVLPLERGVRSAQERGRLLPAKGRMARRFDRLAAALTDHDVDEIAS